MYDLAVENDTCIYLQKRKTYEEPFKNTCALLSRGNRCTKGPTHLSGCTTQTGLYKGCLIRYRISKWKYGLEGKDRISVESATSVNN